MAMPSFVDSPVPLMVLWNVSSSIRFRPQAGSVKHPVVFCNKFCNPYVGGAFGIHNIYDFFLSDIAKGYFAWKACSFYWRYIQKRLNLLLVGSITYICLNMAPGRNFNYTDCIIFLISQEDRNIDYPLSVASMVFEGFSQSYKLKHRRDYRDNDLRDKLDRRRSPPRRYSPRRGARSQPVIHGYSPSRSMGKKSDRKHRRKQLLDGQSDFSGSLKISDGTDDRINEGKLTSSGSKNVLGEQLKQVQLDIERLDDHKSQLKTYLEERVQEADSLTSRIQELESQLYKEREECKRITSKIKKFIKAQSRYLRTQDDLKRAEARLQKLGNQLISDTSKHVNEEDSSIDILSDGEPTGNHVISPKNEQQIKASPSRKRAHNNREATEGSKPGKIAKSEGLLMGTTRSEKLSRWKMQHAQLMHKKEAAVLDNGNSGSKSLTNEGKHKRGKNVSASIPAADKLKGLEPGPALPSTSMAAHAVDEVETVELAEPASREVDNVSAYELPGLPFPPPPPPPHPQNAYSQYKGEDENVDVDGNEEEMVDVDTI